MRMKRWDVLLSFAVAILCLIDAVSGYLRSDLIVFWREIGLAICATANGFLPLVRERENLRRIVTVVFIVGAAITATARHLLLGT
jgi:hypothetical protein